MLRGEESTEILKKPLGKRSCSWSSGMEVKVHRELSKLGDIDRLAEVDSVEKCTMAARKCFSEKGGCRNVKAESTTPHMIQ